MKQNTIGTTWEEPVHGRRVLLIDDDELLRDALSKVLQEWSFATSTAATFREARHVMLTEPPFTVIVCDYHLPDGDGLEFLDWLKREMRIQVPFLLISGGVPREPSAADDYQFLAKPFLMEEFRNRLEALGCLKLQPAVPYSLTTAQEAMASVNARCRPTKGK